MRAHLKMSLQRIMIASTGVIMISIAAIGIAQQKTTAIDTEALNATEEFSESLANDLLDLSVAARDKDRTMIEQYFADDLIATPIPVTPLDRPGAVAWITNRNWPTGSVGSIDRDTFLLGLENLLEHFLSIEDVRFKVKQASFDNQGNSAANISFFIVGRNPTGRREWLTATALSLIHI